MGLFLVFPSITFREGRNVVLYVGRELIQFLIQPCCAILVGQYFVKCINYLTLKLCDAGVQCILEGWVACISKGYKCVSITGQWLADRGLVVLQAKVYGTQCEIVNLVHMECMTAFFSCIAWFGRYGHQKVTWWMNTVTY